ncbi:tripartite motif-containing protein 16-like [Poecilia formosa]|uniref:tripartite motif-containing protein 16-like n=1 Tax=Poecilia formosa TaxID=48698 RepID=UPI0004439DF9|nr:PREDICTED: tripartite motif-containing protein 16-like [Poecilia formosa]
MEQNQLDQETFSCLICLDLLKDPVTTACGHSYCMNCIETHWDGESWIHWDGVNLMRIYSCPQCRERFIPRPVLKKNTMLAALVEQLKLIWLQAAPGDHCYAGHKDVACDFCTGRKLKAIKSCLVCLASYCEKHLQPHYDVGPLKKHKLEEPSKNLQENICSKHDEVMIMFCFNNRKYICLTCFMDEHKGHITVSAATEETDAELEQLSHTEDHSKFLLNYPSLPTLSKSTHSSSIIGRPLRYFEDARAAVSELTDKLQDVLKDSWTNILHRLNDVDVLLPGPEPKSRAGFLKYSCEITLDPNTAHTQLLPSEGNRKVTGINLDQSYSSNPDRFTYWCQVLSRESLTGRCYWEVERCGAVDVAVAYKNISRAGDKNECGFGNNEKSWALECSQNSFHFGHKDIWTPISAPVPSRVGVYLDHRAGILSFYSVSETMTLLHRVQTRFTEPLLAGVWVGNPGDSVEFCKLR